MLATDVSTKALSQAASGIYPADRLAELPREWHRKYFQRGGGAWEGHYRVKGAIRERIRFQQLNLLGAGQFRDTFEVIFCRNVMICFDRGTREQLVNQLGRRLAPRGYLLIGHSESLNGLSVPFRCGRPSVYQKTGEGS